MEEIILTQKLFSVRKMLTDAEDIKIIDSLIDKSTIDIATDFEFSDREKYSSDYFFKNISKDLFKIPDPWIYEDGKIIGYNEDLWDRIDLFAEELNNTIETFSLLRIKNRIKKNLLSRQNSILLKNLFIEKHLLLIKKYDL